MSYRRTRADRIASNDDVVIGGYTVGDRRTVVVVVHNRSFDIDYFDSELLGEQFGAALQQSVPSALRDAVMDWLDRTGAA